MAAALVTGGCASTIEGSLTSARVPYTAANKIYPYGYSATQLAPDRYRIEIGGYPTSPKAHLEKLATVRAAEIGVEERLGYFKIESMTHSEHCTAARAATNKTAGHGELRRSVLLAEVSYAKSPPDATYQQAKQTFQALRPELDTEIVTPELPATSQPANCS